MRGYWQGVPPLQSPLKPNQDRNGCCHTYHSMVFIELIYDYQGSIFGEKDCQKSPP